MRIKLVFWGLSIITGLAGCANITQSKDQASSLVGDIYIGTTLTGAVTAPDDADGQRQIYPVNIVLDRNDSLPGGGGCFVGGEGIADIAKKRFFITLRDLSCVGDNGRVFEEKVTGIVYSMDNQEGIHGAVEQSRTTGVSLLAVPARQRVKLKFLQPISFAKPL